MNRYTSSHESEHALYTPTKKRFTHVKAGQSWSLRWTLSVKYLCYFLYLNLISTA